MGKALIAIPTTPVLDYGPHEKLWKPTEWDLANRKWEAPAGRLNGSNSPRQQAVRDTWWRHIPAPDVVGKFFVGRTGQEDEHTVKLDVADGYLDLIDKIRAIFVWALERDFDHVLKCDDDTFLYPGIFDFLRRTNADVTSYLWTGYCLSGGTGYVFSRRAMQCVLATPRSSFPHTHELEDHWMSEAIKAGGIVAENHSGFTEEINIQPPVRLTFHPVSPKGMRQMYSEFYKGLQPNAAPTNSPALT